MTTALFNKISKAKEEVRKYLEGDWDELSGDIITAIGKLNYNKEHTAPVMCDTLINITENDIIKCTAIAFKNSLYEDLRWGWEIMIPSHKQVEEILLAYNKRPR